MKVFAPLYERALAWARHRNAPALLGVLSFVEAVFFPVMPEVMLAPMALSQPQLRANLASTLRKRGKLAEAETMVREGLALVTKDVSPFTEASLLAVLGMVLIDQRRDAEAAVVLQRVIDIRSARLKPDHPSVVVVRKELDAVKRRLASK